MVLSHRIHKARKVYKCAVCRKTIRPGDMYHRLFGRAEPPDPFHELTICTRQECELYLPPVTPRKQQAS